MGQIGRKNMQKVGMEKRDAVVSVVEMGVY